MTRQGNPDSFPTPLGTGETAASTPIENASNRIASRDPDERFWLLFHLPGIGAAQVDPVTGRFVAVNEKICEITGYKAEELLSMTFVELTHPEDREHDLVAYERARRRETSGWTSVKRYIRKDGTLAWVRVTGTLGFDEEGTPVHSLATVEDITGQREAERLQREREELEHQLTAVAETAPGVICSFRQRPDGSACFPYASPGIQDIYGFRPEDLRESAEPAFALLHPKDVERVRASVRESARAMTPWFAEFRVSNPKKGEIWVEGHSIPQKQADGSTLWHGFIRDITAHKQTEEALRRNLSQSEAIYHQMTEGMVLFDAEGHLLDVNPAALAMHGLETAEGLRRHWADLNDTFEFFNLDGSPLPTESRPVVRALRGETFSSYEIRIRHRDTGRNWVSSCGGAPIYGPEGELERALVTLRDVTAEREAEEALRESEARFRAMADGLPLIVWVHDAQGQQEYVNQTYCEFFGVTREEMRSDRWQGLVHPDDLEAYVSEFLTCLRARSTYHDYVRVRRADGAWRWVESWGRPRFSSSGEFLGYVGVSADMTDRKELEEELRQAKETAERASRAKSDFLAAMSHEIRTPMNGIMGMVELALLKDPSPDVRSHLEAAQESADHLLDLINDILDLAKVEAGKVGLKNEVFSLRSKLGLLLNSFRPLARKRGVRLRATITPEVPDRVVGDRGKLRQVLTNLLGNALKFTEEGEVELRVFPEPTGNGESRIAFTVRDTGIGIAPDTLQEVFEGFSQAHVSHHAKYGGTGLGLTISKQLVELMGGEITVESHPGKGSTFMVVVPLAPVAEAGDRRDAESAEEAHAGKASLRILLAEDNEINRRVAAGLLKHLDHDVVEARNGREAVEAWRRQPFDLVLMDVEMPGMDGLEATRLIREEEVAKGSRTPVVALTAHAIRGHREQFLAAGMDDYLSKPFTLEKLAAVLDAVAVRHQG